MTPNDTPPGFARTGAGIARKSTLSHARPLILIAEDDSDSREMLELLLQNKGYGIVSADDGRQAFDAAVESLPDLVLVDLQLPKRDGLTIARDLRAHPGLKEVPIIMISGHDPLTYRQAAFNAGCNEYLLKPIDFARLDQILYEMIPNNRATAKAG